MRVLTPARHMSVCVPLPVPRAQATITVWWSAYERNTMLVESHNGLIGYIGWHEASHVIRHFGPRRP